MKRSTCNCRDQDSCQLNGKCLQENVVYKATITTQNESKEYIRSIEGPFKKRWYTHISDIRNEKSKGTKLFKYICKLKNNSKSYELKQDIMHRIREFKNVGKTCETCNLEKIEIALADEQNLNKRPELFYTCPYFRKLYFKT